MASLFTKIVRGEIPSYKVAEDANFIAILDLQPVARGHTLVIPKQEIDYLFDMESGDYQALWHFARKVALGLKQAVPCQRVGVSVIGLEVPHTHIHLLPLNSIQDTVFTNPRLTFSSDEMHALAVHISTYL